MINFKSKLHQMRLNNAILVQQQQALTVMAIVQEPC